MGTREPFSRAEGGTPETSSRSEAPIRTASWSSSSSRLDAGEADAPSPSLPEGRDTAPGPTEVFSWRTSLVRSSASSDTGSSIWLAVGTLCLPGLVAGTAEHGPVGGRLEGELGRSAAGAANGRVVLAVGVAVPGPARA